MTKHIASVQYINQLNYKALTIPSFQRPYVWSVKHIKQLWDDILCSQALKKEDYRIGTIILHDDGKNLEIVDGQQRLTSLCLMLYFLQPKAKNQAFHQFFNKRQFAHHDTEQHLKENAEELKTWITDEIENPQELFEYILNRCSVVVIIVKDIAEAFQMFDSQNGRGLPLEAYNLLKAYHVSTFNTSLEKEVKAKYDQDWEHAAKSAGKDYLKQVINEQLYRTRKWARREEAYIFDKKKIREFKGSTKGFTKYPFENFAYHFSETTEAGKTMRWLDEVQSTHTEICQPIINGTPFFDYVQHYVCIYKLLFENRKHPEFKFFSDFYHEYCNYKHHRVGDGYLLEVYKAATMLVFDRFGLAGLKQYYKLIYAFIYRFRVEKKFVKYNSVAKYPIELIARIKNAQDLLDLNFLKPLAIAPITRAPNSTKHLKIEDFLIKEYQIQIVNP